MRLGLIAIVVVYLLLGVAYALKVPKWNAPDEPAHYNYVRHLAEGRGLPILRLEDWNLEYQSRLISAQFPDDLPVDTIRYESWQPPLYYVVSTPVYLATAGLGLAGQVLAMRLLSVGLGALLLIVTFLCVREIFPSDRWLPLLAVSFVALVPMYGAINASITNDSLANLLTSTIVLVLVVIANPARHAESDAKRGLGEWLVSVWWRPPLALGVLLGLGFLTKTTVYLAVVLVAWGALWVAPRPWREHWRGIVAWLAIVYGVAMAVAGWWFVRNAVTYGNLDIIGKQWHDAVVVGQPRTGVFDWATAGHLARTTFDSFWAQFGWMAVPADQRTFRVIGILCAIVVVGLIAFCLQVIRRKVVLTGFQRGALGLLLVTLALVVGMLVWYNLTFIQAQGRYLFPAMVTFGTLYGLGLRQIPIGRLSPALYGVITFGLVGLNVYCLFRVIGPAFGT